MSNDNISKKDNEGRNAWRKLLIPAVGSGAFFASMLVSIINTYHIHGFPKNAFRLTDYLLMSIPIVVIAVALSEEINGHSTED
jgi:hypothetical protein